MTSVTTPIASAQTAEIERALTSRAHATAACTHVAVVVGAGPRASAAHADHSRNAADTSSACGFTVPARNRHIGVIATADAHVAQPPPKVRARRQTPQVTSAATSAAVTRRIP